MSPSPRKVANRFSVKAIPLNLPHYDLEGLAEGSPVTLYHGTAASFKVFSNPDVDMDTVREWYSDTQTGWVGGLSVDDKPRVYAVREPVTG